MNTIASISKTDVVNTDQVNENNNGIDGGYNNYINNVNYIQQNYNDNETQANGEYMNDIALDKIIGIIFIYFVIFLNKLKTL